MYTITFSSVNDELLTGSHALVLFEEELRTAVVPKERVVVTDQDDDRCDVMWVNKKIYQGKLLLLG